MGTSIYFLLTRALILTTIVIVVAMNAAFIVALAIRKDCEFAEVMELPNTFLMLFVLLSFDFAIYLAFELLWPATTTADHKMCSQLLLENGHDCIVGNEKNPLINATCTDDDHVLGELQGTIKALGAGLDPVLGYEHETTLREQVVVVHEQDETFDIGKTPMSKIPDYHLGQTIGKDASISKTLHTEPTDSFGGHDSFFLSEHRGNVRNPIPPCGQAPTSELHSTKNMLDMLDYLRVEGFANGEVVRDAVSAALSQQVAKLISAACNEKNDTLKFNNGTSSSMNFGQVRQIFSAHLQFADILDDFWGNLFDLHGNLTEKGKIIRLDLLIGLNVEEKIKSCPSWFDGTPRGLHDPFKLVNLSTMRAPSLFRSNSTCPEQRIHTLPAVVDLRRCIMDSFLKENPSLLKDEKISYFVIANHQVHYEVPTYEKFYSVPRSIDMLNNSASYWTPCPLEELNAMTVLVQKCPSEKVAQQASKTNVYFSYNELKGLLLNSFQGCIYNIAEIDKSDWLFGLRGEYDEKLVGLAAEMVIFRDICPSGKFSPDIIVDSDGKMFNICTSTLSCGDECMWLPSLIISFGVWCISRIFEVLLPVKQSVVLGKYSRVLNRLQGILDPAFLNPIQPVSICPCTDTVPDLRLPDGSRRISAEAMLKNLMEVEATIYGRNRAKVGGRGKKNLKYVLNRYKRLLSKVASQE